MLNNFKIKYLKKFILEFKTIKLYFLFENKISLSKLYAIFGKIIFLRFLSIIFFLLNKKFTLSLLLILIFDKKLIFISFENNLAISEI